MAFGKLIWKKEKEGDQEFLITRPDTGIGRQSTNDITIEHPSVSRYHARLQVADGGVLIVDLESAHGTFVNDQPISPETPALLKDGDHIVIGGADLIFTMPAARRVVNLIPEASLISDDRVPFSFKLDEPQQTVAPGARLQLEVQIENHGSETASFRVTVGGLRHDWVSAMPRSIKLAPEASGTCMLTIKPPRTSDTHPGRYALSVRVEDELSPKVYLETVREIDVAGFTGFGITTRSLAGRGEYKLALINYGNMPTRVSLRGEDARARLSYLFEPDELQLESGESGAVKITVQEKRPHFFGTPPIPFKIIAQSIDQASFQAPLASTYTPQAQAVTVLKYGSIATAAGVFLALVIAVGAFLLIDPFGLRVKKEAAVDMTATSVDTALVAMMAESAPSKTLPPAPTIQSFTADTTDVVYRTSKPITFNWQADNYANIHLLDWQGSNQLEASDIATEQTSLDSAALPTGNVDFTLKVWDDLGSSESALVIHVRVVACHLAGDAALYTSADGETPLDLPLPDAVFIIGRQDAVQPQWAAVARYPEDAQVAPDLLVAFGWVLFDSLICDEDIPLKDYLILE